MYSRFFLFYHAHLLHFISLECQRITIITHRMKTSTTRESDINLFRFVSFSLVCSLESVCCLYQWHLAVAIVTIIRNENRRQNLRFIWIFGYFRISYLTHSLYHSVSHTLFPSQFFSFYCSVGFCLDFSGSRFSKRQSF